MGTRSFTDLEVYEMCRQLRIKVALLTECNFPETEKYKLNTESLKDFKNDIDSCARLINGYIRHLKNTKAPKDED